MPEDLSKIISAISKDLGGTASITHMSQVKTPYHIRRPTGILGLDRALRGGWPAGTLVQIFGPDGVGKDYLSNLTMAQNQRIMGDASNLFWMSFGYKPDLDFMRLAGMQLAYTDDELKEKGIDPEEATPEQRGTTVGNVLFIDVADSDDAFAKPSETLFSGVLSLLGTCKFQIGVVNELGSGETRHNVKKKLGEEAKMASWATLMSDFLRKGYTELRRFDEHGEPNATTLMALLPVRANLDAYSAKFNPHTQTSGYALKHAKAIDLHLRPGGVFRGKGGVKIGKEIKWKIAKGKHGISEGAEGSYDFYFNKGVDLIPDLIGVAKSAGVIFNKGRFYYVLDYEDRIEGGLDGVVSLVREDLKLQQEIREAVLSL